MTLTRAAAYYRRSSDKQEASIARQRESVEAYARAHDYAIVAEYIDDAISGDATEQRAGFLRMREDAARGGFRVILCDDQDRFGRFDSLEGGYWIKPLRDARVSLVTVKDGPVNWDDFAGRLMYQIKQEGKHQFLHDLSRLTAAGQVRNAKRAYFNGGTVPYAFDRLLLDNRDRPVRRLRRGEKTDKPRGWHTVLIPVEDSQEIETARWLFRSFADRDVSARALANELNARGVPGPGSAERGRPTRWCRQTVLNVLENPNYVGDGTYGRVSQGKYCRVIGGEARPVVGVPKTKSGQPKKQVNAEGLIFNPECHEGIIDRELWDRVQKKLEARRRDGSFPHGEGYPLAGLVRCGHCGKKMHGCTNRTTCRKNPRIYRRYVCTSYNLSGPSTCGYHAVREDLLLPFLVRRLQADYLAPAKIDRLRERLLKKLEARRRPTADQAQRLRARLAEVDGQLKAATLNVVRAKDNLDLLNAALTELRHERDRLAAELGEADARKGQEADLAALVEEAVGKLRALAERLNDADPARLREVLSQMVKTIELYFEAVPKKRKVYHRLVKGVVKLRPQVDEARIGLRPACERNTSSMRLIPRPSRKGVMCQ
jgi:DNA invertase Pin-like site-specific DNA recombinase